MKKIIYQNVGIRNKNIFSFHFQFLIIILIISFIFSNSKRHIRIISIYNSEIRLVINTPGEQDILSSSFYKEPLEVKVNGITKSSCKKKCNLEDNINNITLIFDDDINSCENMFKDLLNIKEVDLSNFDTSMDFNFVQLWNKYSIF